MFSFILLITNIPTGIHFLLTSRHTSKVRVYINIIISIIVN